MTGDSRVANGGSQFHVKHAQPGRPARADAEPVPEWPRLVALPAARADARQRRCRCVTLASGSSSATEFDVSGRVLTGCSGQARLLRERRRRGGLTPVGWDALGCAGEVPRPTDCTPHAWA